MANMTAPRAFYGHLDESLVLVLKGQIRYMTARAVRSFFDGFLLEQGRDAVVIDLRELDFIDSTGMGLLARIGRATLEHGRRSVIVCADRDVLITEARKLAQEIAACSPLAVQGTKDVIMYSRDKGIYPGLEYVAQKNAAAIPSEDMIEAATAFMEKRPPVFQGK